MVNEHVHSALSELWVFGYGSLIWRPGFEYERCQPAAMKGYERRFCQASHDHRGTPDRPGRVVTLIPVTNGLCEGVAYQLPEKGRNEIFRYLDKREQDGYERIYWPLTLRSGQRVPGVTWIAHESNPSWRGGESVNEVAQLVARSSGPSGSNRDYLYQLENALDSMAVLDLHIRDLSNRVRTITAGDSASISR